MNPIINSNGILINDFNEIFDNLTTGYQGIYGNDIDLSQNTPDGQIVGIETKALSDMSEFCVALYNSFDPDFAMGLALNKILKLNGIKQQQATKSSVDITLVCDKTVSLPSDYTIKDTNSQKWVIDEAKTLNSGTHLITFYSELFGKFEALPNTVNQFDTIVLGVVSVNNIASATVGINEYTDEELRALRNKILMKNSNSTVGGLIGKLYDFCTDVVVYENKINIYDSDLALDGNSIWVICDGGEVDDIARTIAIETTSCGLKGSIEAQYIETVMRSNRETFIYTHNVKFDRPNITEIYITLDVKKKTLTSTIDINLIKQNLSLLEFNINVPIVATELYSAIYQSGNGFIASNIQLSKDDVAYVSDTLIADYDEKFKIVVANIEVTEI